MFILFLQRVCTYKKKIKICYINHRVLLWIVVPDKTNSFITKFYSDAVTDDSRDVYAIQICIYMNYTFATIQKLFYVYLFCKRDDKLAELDYLFNAVWRVGIFFFCKSSKHEVLFCFNFFIYLMKFYVKLDLFDFGFR